VKDNWHPSSNRVKTLPFLKYAAVAVLFISACWGGYAYLSGSSDQKQDQYLTISTGTREVKKVDLPDGSIVWLNANSHIRIHTDFQGQTQRDVYLDEGEAFFKVKRNIHRPFLVYTGSISTRVLGTSFNINAYKELHKSVVSVVTGRVQVSTPANVLGVITPGLQISYYLPKGKFQISRSDTLQAHSWTEGQFTLNQASFAELALIIRNVYGIRLTGSHKATTTYKYNLHINASHSLDETMKVICSVHQNTYRREKDGITIH
jgi:ferric-dicitrate binding protein FerR (iron transport regulator)